jgi:hypothetical protein
VEPAVFLVALLSTVGIAAFTVIRVAKVIASRGQTPAGEMSERLEDLEGTVADLQRELSDAQQRLDFAERLLASVKETHGR